MAVGELRVRVRARDGTAVVDLVGDVSASAEPALEEGYDAAREVGNGSVVLNFAGTEYINSTGIALIVGLLARARADGVEVAACGLSEHYREIFEITRLADFMTITDSEERAVTGAEGSEDA